VLAGNFAIGLISFAASTILLTRETKAMLIGEAASKNPQPDATRYFVRLATQTAGTWQQ
jgi:hypothetical protein